MGQVTFGEFYTEAYQNRITVGRVGKTGFTFTIADFQIIKDLVHLALGLENLPLRPPHIDTGKVQIKFCTDTTLSLRYSDSPENEVEFSWVEGDDLLVALEEGYKIFINNRRFSGGGPIVPFVPNEEPY